MAFDSFCFLAFTHLQITPAGTARLCCIAQEEIAQGGKPLSFYRHRLDEVWNSDYMVRTRRAMAEGERVAACHRCYRDEASSGESHHTQMNAFWSRELGLSEEEMLKLAATNGFLCLGNPVHYQLNMGNLCNLACRSCSGDLSTRILADPVLPQWNPGALHDFPKWHDGQLTLGPQEFAGVEIDGLYPPELDRQRRLVRWSGGNSDISMRLPEDLQLDRLKMSLVAPPGTSITLRLTLNGMEIFFGEVSERGVELDLPVGDLIADGKFRLRFLSSTASLPGDERGFGAGLLHLALTGVAGSGAERRSPTRFAAPGGWWDQADFLFGELLSNPASLRRLMLQGGEPLLNKQTPALLDHLVASGAARNILLEIITNFTQLSDAILAKLAKFERIELWASVDGLGPLFEYIRHPGKWEIIAANVARVKAIPNIHLTFAITIQAYNLLHLADLLDFCDRNDISCMANILVGPGFLSSLVLPLEARNQAFLRLQACHARARTEGVKSTCQAVMDYLTQKADIQYCDMIESFMLFTNDLDASRGQNILELNRELVDAFAAFGKPWDERRQYWKA